MAIGSCGRLLTELGTNTLTTEFLNSVNSSFLPNTLSNFIMDEFRLFHQSNVPLTTVCHN